MEPPKGRIKAGKEAVIHFSIEPAETDLSKIKLMKVPAESEEAIPVPVAIYNINLEKKEIVFPKLAMENAGTYVLCCNGSSSDAFNLEVAAYGRPSVSKLVMAQS